MKRFTVLVVFVVFAIVATASMQAQPNPQVVATLSVTGNGLMANDNSALWFAHGNQMSVVGISPFSVYCTLTFGTSGTITGVAMGVSNMWVASTNGTLYHFNPATERGDACAGASLGSYSLGSAAAGQVAVVPGAPQVWVVMANGGAEGLDTLNGTIEGTFNASDGEPITGIVATTIDNGVWFATSWAGSGCGTGGCGDVYFWDGTMKAVTYRNGFTYSVNGIEDFAFQGGPANGIWIPANSYNNDNNEVVFGVANGQLAEEDLSSTGNPAQWTWLANGFTPINGGTVKYCGPPSALAWDQVQTIAYSCPPDSGSVAELVFGLTNTVQYLPSGDAGVAITLTAPYIQFAAGYAWAMNPGSPGSLYVLTY